MCCLFGFYNYSGTPIHNISRLTNALAEEATARGTDATGIAYNHKGRLVIHKEPKSAFQVDFKHPDDTVSVTGHTRHSTQGNKNKNYNNHPFSGRCKNANFALAHNGVLTNDNSSVFCDSPIISYYEEIIKYSFETKNIVLDVEALEIQREMMAYTLSILCVLFPPTETRSHKLFYNKETNKFDFEAVGDFLIKDCKIPVLLSEYKELIEKNINNNLYVKTIQELLLNNDVVEQKILSNSAKKMKGFKKIN